jgi:hypothetical protein
MAYTEASKSLIPAVRVQPQPTSGGEKRLVAKKGPPYTVPVQLEMEKAFSQ